MIVIDGTNLILGRLATQVAKKALLGETVSVINCEKTVISGEKKEILARYRQKRERGAPLVGPYVPRQSERLVKRTIRGMLPYKQPKGREAFKRILCYKTIPKELQDKKAETIKEADISKVVHAKYLTMKDVCAFLGGK